MPRPFRACRLRNCRSSDQGMAETTMRIPFSSVNSFQVIARSPRATRKIGAGGCARGRGSPVTGGQRNAASCQARPPLPHGASLATVRVGPGCKKRARSAHARWAGPVLPAHLSRAPAPRTRRGPVARFDARDCRETGNPARSDGLIVSLEPSGRSRPGAEPDRVADLQGRVLCRPQDDRLMSPSAGGESSLRRASRSP